MKNRTRSFCEGEPGERRMPAQKTRHIEESIPKNVPVRQGEILELAVEGLGSGAEGVAHTDGFTVFVTGALPGERVRARINLVKKSYATAELVEISAESPSRVRPSCPLYPACGGCQLQHLSYEGQLSMKRRQVEDALRHIGGFEELSVLPTIGADNPWGYRNKMQFPVGRTPDGIVIGCFARRSHIIIDAEGCLIQKETNNIILRAARDIVRELGIPPYDEDRHTGVLRHVMGRVGKDGDAMVVLVTATRELQRAKEIVRRFRDRVPRLVSVQQNIQTYRNNVILGRETKLLWGRPTILDDIGALSFRVSPRSFFQVNTEQAGRLYDKTLEYADLHGTETVIDAYCGTGTITLFLARKARRAYGIEIVKPAILDAERNARDNHIRNASFLVGDAAAVMPHLYHQGVRPEVIVVDPPRAGCASSVLEVFARMKPRRIVYVSCNPATLARDLAILRMLGYVPEELQPVDMFPMTSHVEVCARLVKVD